jgi:dynein heavy chain
LDRDKGLCEKRLENAGKLINLLADEGERWKLTVEVLKVEMEKIVGNVFIAANMISYIGPFTV